MQVLEGLWEDILAQSEVLRGKRVRVEVLESAADDPLDALVGLIPADEGDHEVSRRHDAYVYPDA